MFLWLDGMREAETERLASTLANATGRIQSEASLEFAALAVMLSYAWEVRDLDDDSFLLTVRNRIPESYSKWLDATRFPGLVRVILLTDIDKSGLSETLAAETQIVAGNSDTETIPPQIVDEMLSSTETEAYRLVSFPEGLALAVPVELSARERSKYAPSRATPFYLIVLLDRRYFVETMVGELIMTYLESTGENWHYVVVDYELDEVLNATTGAPRQASKQTREGFLPKTPDQSVPLTTWPEADESLLTGIFRIASKGGSAPNMEVMSARFKDLFIRQWYGASKGAFPRSDTERQASAESEPERGIYLHVWHSKGSIQAAARFVRNRRLAAGYAALASLVVVAVIYYVLYLRARHLREREHEFVATVTHELRTPVSGITAVADNLAAGIVTDQDNVRAYGVAILNNGRRLRNLIDQILLYAGLSVSRPGMLRAVDVSSLVHGIADSVPPIDRNRLVIHVQESIGSVVLDPTAVETIISNLLSNAVKHAGRTAAVTLSVYSASLRERRLFVIRMSDTGVGIPRSEITHLTEPFYRGERSRRDQTPGTGLGLSIVARIVRIYGGTFTIDSTLGRGTIVTVRLPVDSVEEHEC